MQLFYKIASARMCSHKRVNNFVRGRLSDILSEPDSLRTPAVVEEKILTLLEVTAALHGRDKPRAKDTVRERWNAYLVRKTRDLPIGEALHFGSHRVSLSSRLGLRETATPRFIEILQRFSDKEIRKSTHYCWVCAA